MARRIAFIGPRHSGKTTASKIAMDAFFYHGFPVTKLAFADALKDAYVEAFKTFQREIGQPDTFNRTELERDKSLHRRELEDFGTVHGRQRYGDDLWIRMMDKKLDALDPSVSILVDDCRFLNEAEVLQAHGFVLVRIERPLAIRAASVLGIPAPATAEQMQIVLDDKMPSEVELHLIDCDETIINITAEQLKNDINELIP